MRIRLNASSILLIQIDKYSICFMNTKPLLRGHFHQAAFGMPPVASGAKLMLQEVIAASSACTPTGQLLCPLPPLSLLQEKRMRRIF